MKNELRAIAAAIMVLVAAIFVVSGKASPWAQYGGSCFGLLYLINTWRSYRGYKP